MKLKSQNFSNTHICKELLHKRSQVLKKDFCQHNSRFLPRPNTCFCLSLKATRFRLEVFPWLKNISSCQNWSALWTGRWRKEDLAEYHWSNHGYLSARWSGQFTSIQNQFFIGWSAANRKLPFQFTSARWTCVRPRALNSVAYLSARWRVFEFSLTLLLNAQYGPYAHKWAFSDIHRIVSYIWNRPVLYKLNAHVCCLLKIYPLLRQPIKVGNWIPLMKYPAIQTIQTECPSTQIGVSVVEISYCLQLLNSPFLQNGTIRQL